MLRIIIIVSALLIGLILAPDISANKGYILISFDTYTTYETTIINAAFIALAFYLLLLCAEWLLRKLFSMSAMTKGWLGQHNSKKTKKNNLLGMLALLEGKSKQAQKLLVQSAQCSESPALIYIGAAKAAQQQEKYDLRDQYLQQASDSQKGCQLAVGLVWVELQLEAKQYENAQATLQALAITYPKNQRINELYLSIYPALGQWQQYIDLLNSKRSVFSFTEMEVTNIQLDAYQHLFKQLASQSAEALHSYWEKKTPRWMAKELSYQKALLDAYIDAGADNFAEQFLLAKLNKQFSLPLLPYIEKLDISNHYPLILLLQKKLKKEAEIGLIHQALAKLMLEENRPLAAIEHLQESIKTVANAADFALLAELLENEGRAQEAQDYYRQGLLFALSLK